MFVVIALPNVAGLPFSRNHLVTPILKPRMIEPIVFDGDRMGLCALDVVVYGRKIFRPYNIGDEGNTMDVVWHD